MFLSHLDGGDEGLLHLATLFADNALPPLNVLSLLVLDELHRIFLRHGVLRDVWHFDVFNCQLPRTDRHASTWLPWRRSRDRHEGHGSRGRWKDDPVRPGVFWGLGRLRFLGFGSRRSRNAFSLPGTDASMTLHVLLLS